MTPGPRTLATVAATYAGAIVLVALPVAIVLSSAVVALLGAIGLSSVENGSAGPVVLATALVVGIQLAIEAAGIYRHGLAALPRGGSRTRLVRFLSILVSTVFVLGLTAWYGLVLVVGEPTWYVATLGALVVLATVIGFVRASSALEVYSKSNST